MEEPEPNSQPEARDSLAGSLSSQSASNISDPASIVTRSRRPAGASDKAAGPLIANLRDELHDIKRQLSESQLELANTRSLPSRVFQDFALNRILSFLSRKSPPLPARMAARFARSALKRNPLRSLPETMIEASGANLATSSNSARTSETGSGLKSDPNRKTLMVVSHEASRTGAPILALNIAQSLARKHNVVVVVLGGGVLLDEFRATSVAMYELTKHNVNDAKMKEISRRHDVAYALVNSIESRSVVPGLKAAGVPTVALLHEFASYTRPRSAFSDVLRDADQVVFSTRITLENALEEYGIARGTGIHILPQGKCLVPSGKLSEAERIEERAWLDSIFRPTGELDREFVVLGVGTVEPRKAVDLFLECATRVIASPGGGRFRFIWIGNGYDPEKDMFISAYLADQIKRAGIQGQVRIVGPTSEIEYAYRAADVLLLSSRLDPLPNVAIDALVAGTPVLCFERTTGIADFLLENGLGHACVAAYLDTSQMAKKILAFANSEIFHTDIAAQGRDAAHRIFDFATYVDKLDAIASNRVPAASQISADAEYIMASGRFRADFFCPPNMVSSGVADVVGRYLAESRSGHDMRKPMPGFNPCIYAAQQHQVISVDPFVSYLREGAPVGPWSFRVIDQQSEIKLEEIATMRVALHVHVTEPKLLSLINLRLKRNVARPDIFISTTEEYEHLVRAALADLPWTVTAFEVVPDRGGAIAALLSGFGDALAQDYEFIGQFHAAAWPAETFDPTDILLENLIGGEISGAMLDRILTAAAVDSTLTLVYPDDPYICGWADSRAAADRLAHQLGIDRLQDQVDFPTAGMFWARDATLRRFLALDLDWGDYPACQADAEGGVADALERLLGVVPRLDGMQTAVTNVRGLTW